jgi:RNA polymerase sigma-70 factor (ECF subfamily)
MSRLLEVLAPWVGRICGSIALDAGPDATQETLFQVFRDLSSLREPEALRGWVRRIAAREAVRHAERERRFAKLAAEREIPAANDPALAADVRSVLAALGPEQRAILVLRDLEGLSEEEAARQLAVAKGTAKSRLHRARRIFRKRWSS